jgi:predicted permease
MSGELPGYWTLLALVLPVFAVIAAGAAARRACWLKPEADESLLKLVVNLLYPCLIFDNVLGNAALRTPGNLLAAPLLGFVTMAAGIPFAYLVARRAGFAVGSGLRTFAFSVGIYNYGYMAIPLVERLFGRDTLGVLFVFNVGCEAAIWTVGILMLAGVSLREGWRRVLNPPVYALVLALALNLSGGDAWLPGLLRQAIKQDPTFVPALNNLGVVLMEQGKAGEARRVFQQAFALDSGETDSIRENLRLAIAQSESSVYAEPKEEPDFTLVRRGQGRFVLLSQL